MYQSSTNSEIQEAIDEKLSILNFPILNVFGTPVRGGPIGIYTDILQKQ